MITLTKSFIKDEYTAFPVGVYVGTMDRVEEVEFGEAGSNDWAYRLRLFFRDIKPGSEGSPEVGNRPFRGEITVISRGQSLVDITDGDVANLPFPLERGLKLLGQIGLAVGAIEIDNSNADLDVGELVEALRSGQFDGAELVFQVTHYTDNSGTERDQLAKVASA